MVLCILNIRGANHVWGRCAPGLSGLEAEYLLYRLAARNFFLLALLITLPLCAFGQEFAACSRHQDNSDKALQHYTAEARNIVHAIFQLHVAELPAHNFAVRVGDQSKPYAYIMPSGEILISLGLMKRAVNSSELVFVLSHEMAHHAVESTNSQAALFGDTPQQALQVEMAADRVAVKFMNSLGARPKAAQALLGRLQRELSSELPELASEVGRRLEALSSLTPSA